MVRLREASGESHEVPHREVWPERVARERRSQQGESENDDRHCFGTRPPTYAANPQRPGDAVQANTKEQCYGRDDWHPEAAADVAFNYELACLPDHRDAEQPR